jgi:saccharopine dehydrogenase (NAD+, L-lysine-forming)
VNTEITTWQVPVRRLHGGTPEHGTAPLEVIAIDNLPSLLPREASEGFSADLTPHLLGLAEEGGPSGPWRAAGRAFDRAIGELEAPEGS